MSIGAVGLAKIAKAVVIGTLGGQAAKAIMVKYGMEKRLVDIRHIRTAHEAGHALLAWRSPHVELLGVSIVPKPGILFPQDGGHASMERRSWSPAATFDMATVAMGGYAGEFVAYGAASSIRARSDIEDAREDVGRLYPPNYSQRAMRPALDAVLRTAEHRLRSDHAAFIRLYDALGRYGTLAPDDMKFVVGPQA